MPIGGSHVPIKMFSEYFARPQILKGDFCTKILAQQNPAQVYAEIFFWDRVQDFFNHLNKRVSDAAHLVHEFVLEKPSPQPPEDLPPGVAPRNDFPDDALLLHPDRGVVEVDELDGDLEKK